MNLLKINTLLLVGTDKEKNYFENYFNKVILVKSNNEALELYQKNIFSIIFLNFDTIEEDAFSISKKIRQNNYKIVLVILINKLSKENLYNALPLHLSGCILRPMQKKQVRTVLLQVNHDLNLVSERITTLLNGYHYHHQRQLLHNANHQEIKLTKNEYKLFQILIAKKNNIVAEEFIENKIWAEDFYEVVCTNRLKNLLYHLRKKLPKNSITNNYKLGYRLELIE